MKPLFLLILLNHFFCSPTTVYICDSEGAKKYHLKSDCRGLRNCSYKTLKTTLEKAKESGKTLCKWEG